jgi:hypothetical protein
MAVATVAVVPDCSIRTRLPERYEQRGDDEQSVSSGSVLCGQIPDGWLNLNAACSISVKETSPIQKTHRI